MTAFGDRFHRRISPFKAGQARPSMDAVAFDQSS
jgi:hypothetical protein